MPSQKVKLSSTDSVPGQPPRLNPGKQGCCAIVRGARSAGFDALFKYDKNLARSVGAARGIFEIRLESSGRLDGDRDARQRKHCDVVVLSKVHRSLRRLFSCGERREQRLQAIEAVEFAALAPCL